MRALVGWPTGLAGVLTNGGGALRVFPGATGRGVTRGANTALVATRGRSAESGLLRQGREVSESWGESVWSVPREDVKVR